ncbi:MAG: hypothetical protein HOC91_03935 [Nitrospinaceae bacterium]|jgi:hypothetical protein|nr:hypothetical protein [Nitrospinaceae bacterium]MBT3433820.1 hypothetical protein [Nitrospinaceae bacterium]MBT3821375.1 hypothetical protein [Nitrospinaceae bacterium]MBT4093256.1 hypothetical protein [Nitrospinaceae bacterium]MBT4429644.1 hypothetical protein [Nitrospinaceae bacterium]
MGEAGGNISGEIAPNGGLPSGISPKKSGLAGKALLAAAFFACPCHLPIYIALLGGTALGGYLTENTLLVAAALSAVFALSLFAGMRKIKPGQAG